MSEWLSIESMDPIYKDGRQVLVMSFAGDRGAWHMVAAFWDRDHGWIHGIRENRAVKVEYEPTHYFPIPNELPWATDVILENRREAGEKGRNR